MDNETARELNEINQRFYADQATAFSRTRNNSWHGWDRCLEATGLLDGTDVCEVLDVACGNLRFERWLSEKAPAVDFSFAAIDACIELLPEELPRGVTFRECDIVGALVADSEICIGDLRKCNLAVSFGFMHHIPGVRARKVFLEALLNEVQVGGFVAVSFWRFADDPGLLARAQESTQAAFELRKTAGDTALSLDADDYLLGFDRAKGVSRYCHSFQTAEIDELLARVTIPYELVDRFRSDGRTGALNEYVVLRRV